MFAKDEEIQQKARPKHHRRIQHRRLQRNRNDHHLGPNLQNFAEPTKML